MPPINPSFQKNYGFAVRLMTLLIIDSALTIAGSYVPQTLNPLRTGLAVLQLILMAYTMAVTARFVLEDF